MKLFSGGPGSQKGVLTQELAHEFEFTLINVEDIVFSYLPNKVANTVSSIVEIQELLKVIILVQLNFKIIMFFIVEFNLKTFQFLN